MADYRKGLRRVPEHMHDFITMWIERGQPHPKLLGSFERALLLHDFVGFFAWADEENAAHARAWAGFLHNDAPGGSHGTEGTINDWHQRGGLEGIAKRAAASRDEDDDDEHG